MAITSTALTTNISALSNVTTLASGLTNLILATPQTSQTQGYQPQNSPSSNGLLSLFQPPPGILFHYEGEQTITLDSDITDHFIEDNTAIQDQIALRPVVITTHGFIGELNNIPPKALGLLQQASNVLTDLGSYVPGLSVTAQIAYNQAFAAYQLASSAVNAGVSAWSSLTGDGGESVISASGQLTKSSNQNKQQTMFQQLYAYRQNRTLFTVQTPWAIFQNMAILHLRPVQDEATRMITDFDLSFKQINVASTALVGGILQSIGRAATQGASVVNQGTGATNPGPSVAQGLAKQQGSP